MKEKVQKTDEEWKAQLGPERYHVLRESGTERPFSGTFYLHKDTGVYCCYGCQSPLFGSETKFDSGCGWPSFTEPVDSEAVIYVEDNSHGMKRVEVRCAGCDSHLGHVFPDGPGPTGNRFCINSVCLDFEKKEGE